MKDYLETLDGSPAEVAKTATNMLCHEAGLFQEAVFAVTKWVKNAAMSELLEVDPDATPEDLIEAWDASTENKILHELAEAADRAAKLNRIVARYEGYRAS